MCSFLRMHMLTGVDTFVLTDLLKSSSGANLHEFVQLKDVILDVFTALTDTPPPIPSHALLF